MTEAFCVEKWDHFSISHSEYQFYHQNPTDLVILNTSNPLQDKLLTTIQYIQLAQYTLLVTKFRVGKINVF